MRLFGFPLPLPFLFSLYIIDIEKHLIENKISGLESFSNDIDDDLCIFMKLLIFFNAADTVILSETPSNLQYALVLCTVKHRNFMLMLKKTVIFSKGPAP